MLVPSLKKPAADFWEGKILGSRMEHPHRLSSQLLGWKIPYAFPWYWSISFKFHWNLEKPSHMVWESTQTTRETHNNEAANLSGSLSLPQCRFFSHKTVSPYWKNNIFVKWDAFFRTQIYVLICLSRFFYSKNQGFLHFQKKSRGLQLSHSQRSRTLQHIQWCPPLRYEILQWGEGRTCTPKKHRQTAKLGEKSSNTWLNHLLFEHLRRTKISRWCCWWWLFMRFFSFLQPPKKRGNFLWEPPWFLTPNPFFHLITYKSSTQSSGTPSHACWPGEATIVNCSTWATNRSLVHQPFVISKTLKLMKWT